MRRPWVALFAVLAALMVGCIARESTSVGASEATAAPSLSSSAVASPPERVRLPPDFPLPSAAVAETMPNGDPDLAGSWMTDQGGSEVYDFFIAALPAAGYPIVGRYPGGSAAVIRFSLPDATVWQVVMRAGGDGGIVIEVRPDRA